MILDERLKKLQQEIKSQNFDAVLISKVANIIYLTGYSGFSAEEREAFLLVTPNKQYIFTDGRYTEAVKTLIPNFELVEISSKNKFKDLLKKLIKRLEINRLGIEEGDLKVGEYKQIKKIIKNLKDFKFHEHRSIKTQEEIKLIESACEIGDQAFKYIQTKIKADISEKQLMFYLDSFIREKGFEPSFKTIVAFAENSAVPHHQTGERKLKPGDFVLLDFGVKFKNYCSDMTRTVVFDKPSEKQKKMHQVVLEAQQAAREYIKQILLRQPIRSEPHGRRLADQNDKLKASNIDKIARDYILESGFPSIPHSLGHGIGIEVHEHPFLSMHSKEILTVGMVFSIEPGIYLNNFGGVRIEDLYVYEKNGLRQLTTSSKELLIV